MPEPVRSIPPRKVNQTDVATICALLAVDPTRVTKIVIGPGSGGDVIAVCTLVDRPLAP